MLVFISIRFHFILIAVSKLFPPARICYANLADPHGSFAFQITVTMCLCVIQTRSHIVRGYLWSLFKQATHHKEGKDMTLIKTAVLALALVGVLATSASAQMSRADRVAAARDARAQAQSPYQSQRFAPNYNVAGPNHCQTDDGYGRHDTCDH